MDKSLHALIEERAREPERAYVICPVRRGRPRLDVEVCKFCAYKTRCPAKEKP